MNWNRKEYDKKYSKKWRAKNPGYSKKWRLKNPEKNREAQRKYRAKDPEKTRELNTQRNRIWRAKHPERNRASVKRWREANPEKTREASRKWQRANPERVRTLRRKWRAENVERVRRIRRNWKKHKRATDPNWKLAENMRSAMYIALKGEKKLAATMKIIGCTSEGLWRHLESCSSWEPWMTRENYGVGGWDVDHIIAISKWDYKCPLQFALCWDKSNLQPMEHIANISKGAK